MGSITVSELASRYITEHASIHCKASTVTGYRDHLRRYILPALGDKPVASVTRSDVASFHYSLAKVPYQANRCLEMVSKMFNLAEMWGWRPENTNPRRYIKAFRERKRERYLTKEETRKVVGIITDPLLTDLNCSAAYCLLLLLNTGCRLSEILTLRWEFVDEENSRLRLPDSKTGARDVYVSKAVLNILNDIRICPYRPITNPYVIWGQKPDSYLKDIQHRWQRFRKRAGVPDVRIHDLRHTFASYAVSQGMSLPMIGRLLGHTQIQTTARYAHLMSDAVIAAADQVSQRISQLSAL